MYIDIVLHLTIELRITATKGMKIKWINISSNTGKFEYSFNKEFG